MVTEEGTSHPDKTHDGKSFELKQSAWAYINNTGVEETMTSNIDKLGEDVAARIKTAETDKANIGPDLRKIWDALEAKQTVNGVASKGAWARKFGITLRYCQYLVKDGSRKRSQNTNPVRTAKLVEGRMYEMPDGRKVWLEQIPRHSKREQKQFGNEWVLTPVEDEDPVATTTLTVTNKFQQGANGKKTHLLSTYRSPTGVFTNTRCTKDATKVLIAPDGTAPTCQICRAGTSYDSARSERTVTAPTINIAVSAIPRHAPSSTLRRKNSRPRPSKRRQER